MQPYYEDELVTLYHGDCREVLPKLRAEVLVTDPPYGIDLRSGWDGLHGECEIASDADTSVRDWLLAQWGDKPAIVFGSWRRPRPGNTRAVLIWDKGGHSGMGDLSFPWKPNWEEIYVIGHGFYGPRTTSVLSFYIHPTFNAQREHPTEKPAELMQALVAKCPDGSLLDPFAGSGSTLAAAKRIGRRAIGIEIEERYCEVAARRLSQGTLSEMFQ